MGFILGQQHHSYIYNEGSKYMLKAEIMYDIRNRGDVLVGFLHGFVKLIRHLLEIGLNHIIIAISEAKLTHRNSVTSGRAFLSILSRPICLAGVLLALVKKLFIIEGS